MRGEIDRLKADIKKIAPAGKLVIHVKDPETGKVRIVRRPWGGPRDVRIYLDEQDLRLI